MTKAELQEVETFRETYPEYCEGKSDKQILTAIHFVHAVHMHCAKELGMTYIRDRSVFQVA